MTKKQNKDYRKEYYKRNKEKIKLKSKETYRRNKEKLKSYNRERYKQIKDYKKEYYQRNKQRYLDRSCTSYLNSNCKIEINSKNKESSCFICGVDCNDLISFYNGRLEKLSKINIEICPKCIKEARQLL